MYSSWENRKYLIPMEEIKRATNDFSQENEIGSGGFGVVYRGKLSERWENRTVAIKRKDPEGQQELSEFKNELQLLDISHKNIISLIGYCDEQNEMIIAYEYATNGSLEQYLQDPNKMGSISWGQRLKICLGAAQGLLYLHSDFRTHEKIIHRDVKSGNILLDDNMDAKVSDFGLSRLAHKNWLHTEVHTGPAGTQFYLDPMYYESGILTKESDVYSFGVVMFEMLCGMPVYYGRKIGNNPPQTLIELVRRYSNKGEQKKIVDPHLMDTGSDKSFPLFIDLAYKCISHNRDERPTMDRIVKTIIKALEYHDSCYSDSLDVVDL